MGRLRIDNQKTVVTEVEELSADLNEMVHKLVTRYSSELDRVVSDIRKVIYSTEDTDNITNSMLERFVMELSTNIYFLGEAQEAMGLREDVCKGIYNEVFNKFRSTATGTVADKNAKAELSSRTEEVTLMVYSRAYKLIKSKVESAYEVLNSVKKLITRRTAELELSNSRYIGRADRSDDNA